MKSKIVFLRRFFEPAFLDKVTAVKIFLHGLNDVFLDRIIVLIFVPKITDFIASGNLDSALKYSTVALLLFSILFFIRSKFMYYWFFAMSVLFEKSLYEKYIPIILKIEPRFFELNGTGYHLSKFNSGVKAIVSNTKEFLFNVPGIIVIFFISFYLLFNISLQLGFLFIFIMFAFVLIASKVFMGEVERVEPSVEISNMLQANVSRLIMSKNEIIFSDKIQDEVKKILVQGDNIFKIEKNAYKYSMAKLGAIWYFPISTLLIVLFFQTYGLINLSIGKITLLILLSNTIVDSMTSLFRIMGEIFENYNYMSNFIKMVDEPKIKNYENGKKFEHKNGEIILENINFSYGEDLQNKDENREQKNILENFNLKISGGEKIAFVGKSGSGKTTIAKLISGYMNPTSGKVFVDGQDLSEVSLKSYYKYIGYLTQEPMVFDGTIKENLLYAVDGEVAHEKIWEALEKAQCEFVKKTEKGLETQIGEKGIRLSGGERQRLAIAKLFLKNPEIIILDEPTSALDSFSEDLITKALDELFKGRTVIIIAHRLQTVKKADKILVIEDGQILEEGKHDELLKKGGHYAKMLELQTGF